MNTTPIVLADNDGECLWFDNGLLTFKATTEQTGGAFSLFEMHAPKGKASALHVHLNEDETFYVLEGELLIQVDGENHTAGPGSVAFLPRDIPHAFVVTSDTARFLVLMNPGDGEGFFREAADPATTRALPPEALQDVERLGAASARHGVEILGPPPFARPVAAVAGRA